MMRVRSTQKLPICVALERAIARMSAPATAMPTAAETKFCTVSPAVWTSGPTPASPAYDCQFVFVTNETAVLSAVCQNIPPVPCDRGRWPWVVMRANRMAMPMSENAMTLAAYDFQPCSDEASTRTSR